jgi:hypothetical protein
MAVSCDRRIQALWCNEERPNAWAWVEHAGWRKLDDRNDDACTNLLALAAEAKSRNALVSIAEEVRGGVWVVTEIYDFNTGLGHAPQEISFPVSECIYRLDGGLSPGRNEHHGAHPARSGFRHRCGRT